MVKWNPQEGPQKDFMEKVEEDDFVIPGASAGGGGCNKLFAGLAGSGKIKLCLRMLDEVSTFTPEQTEFLIKSYDIETPEVEIVLKKDIVYGPRGVSKGKGKKTKSWEK